MLALFGCQGTSSEAIGKSASAIELSVCEWEACAEAAASSANCTQAIQCRGAVWNQYGPELQKLWGAKSAAEDQIKNAKNAYFNKTYGGGAFAQQECWKVAQKNGLQGSDAIHWCDKQAETDEQVKAANGSLVAAESTYYAYYKVYSEASSTCDPLSDLCYAETDSACGQAPEQAGWGTCN